MLNESISKFNVEEKTILLECDCHDLRHVMQFAYEVDLDCMFILIIAEINRPFWSRIRTAFRFLLGFDKNFLCKDMVISPENTKNLYLFLKDIHEQKEKASRT
jgi:hypothetical protein